MRIVNSLLLAAGIVTASVGFAQDAPKPTRITVEAVGASPDAAKTAAFRSAIEQVVGVVVVSEQEASGARLTRDFIGNYSAGFVDDFETVESYQDGDHWHIKMNVAVSSSKIAQRMLASGKKDLMINGQRIQAQLETQMAERYNGDELIFTVLSGYPQQAYIVNNGQTEVKISRLRRAYLEIPIEIQMSRFWVEALDEALGLVAVDKSSCSTLAMAVADGFKNDPRAASKVKELASRPCGSPDIRVFYKKSGDLFSSSNGYYFNDLETLRMVNQELQPPVGRQRIGLRGELLDGAGNVLQTSCSEIPVETFIRYSPPALASVSFNERRHYVRPDIVAQNKINGLYKIDLSGLANLDDLARVRITVDKSCS